ncbi:MAG TPA: DUF2298 domain-containing protein [Patescibacteria group bacterium]|nr:DUF2298 domain-containing protein [Patescibacteria group bacterium]
MLYEYLIFLKWWVYLLIIGLIFLPLASRIFSKFFDKGYLYSKVLGLAIPSFILWLLSSLRLVPFERGWIIVIILVLLAVIFVFDKGYPNFKQALIENWKIFILEELIFLISLAFWVFVRGLRPEIKDLEKFMDFGFMNSILRTKFMPPTDMWFAGEEVNYYYYGHYLAAFLTKLVNLKPAVGYNLMISTIFAFTLSLTFSLTANLVSFIKIQNFKKIILAGLISAMLISFASNFHTFAYGVFLPAAKKTGLLKGEIKPYYYPEATRFIGYNPPTNDKTIHEFPSYSFVVADLHGHVSNIPFIITFLAILFTLLTRQENKEKILSLGHFLLALMLAIFYMTNIWDFPIYLLVTLLFILYQKIYLKSAKKIILAIVFDFLKLVILTMTLLLPFNLHFQNMTQGIGLVMSRTPIWQIFILWGNLLIFAVMFLIFYIVKIRKDKLKNPSDIFVLIIIFSSFFLLAVPEIIYFKDIYDRNFYRANTMFKFTYQAYIMLTMATGYICLRLGDIKTKMRWALWPIFFILIILPLLYPFYSIPRYYRGLKISKFRTLDGMAYLSKDSPGDHAAIEWLTRLKDQPVILEADGESYTSYDRVSMATGLPTVLGWRVHEWLWRGNYPDLEARQREVKTIYEKGDIKASQEILQKYKVKYIILGDLERKKYQLDEEKLLSLGTVVLDSSQTKIIEVRT